MSEEQSCKDGSRSSSDELVCVSPSEVSSNIAFIFLFTGEGDLDPSSGFVADLTVVLMHIVVLKMPGVYSVIIRVFFITIYFFVSVPAHKRIVVSIA